MKTYFPVAIALLAGAALGYCLAPSAPAPAAPEKTEERIKERHAADEGDKSSVRALRARVRELEKMLAEKGVEVEKMKEEESERATRRERRFDPRAEMERIKKEEPERYAQMTNHWARARQHRIARTQSRMDFLSSIDTSGMSAEARKTHEALQEAIASREQLSEKMQKAMDMSDEEREAAFKEMHETNRRIHELGRQERDNLLTQTAEALGFQGDDAAEVVETVKAIYEATESGHGFGPGGPGGPRGRGGRGGR